LFRNPGAQVAFILRLHTIRPLICRTQEEAMHSIIYIVGLIVVILFILSALGLR
jgi:hypothetical protein